jgi:hypothetical protein
MTQRFYLSVPVTTRAEVSGEQAATILARLIDAGLASTQDMIEAGKGDFELTRLATDLDIGMPVVMHRETGIGVKCWDAYHTEGVANSHWFDIGDQRETCGQAYMAIRTLEDRLNDILSVTMEINTSPMDNSDHLPCVHVHFDNDSLAMSLFKIGGRILVRPEAGTSIQSMNVNGYGEKLYWLE